MIDHDVDVINHSVGWTMETAPATAHRLTATAHLRSVDTAVAAGITWINAAGNNGGTRLGSASFSDSRMTHGYWHNFRAKTMNAIHVNVEAGERYPCFQLRWDDAWHGLEVQDPRLGTSIRVSRLVGTTLRMTMQYCAGGQSRWKPGDMTLMKFFSKSLRHRWQLLPCQSGNYSDPQPVLDSVTDTESPNTRISHNAP